MSNMTQSLAVGVAATVGATFVGTFGAAPATAAQLDFTFSTARGGIGNFTLNTSILDSQPIVGSGLFPNAITNFEYSGVRFYPPLDLSTSFADSQTTFRADGFNGNNQLFNLNLYFSGSSLADKLSDNPADYSTFLSSSDEGSVGFFGGYGGGFEVAQADIDSRITSVTVVPEPSAILGSVIALGFGTFLKKQCSRKLKKISS